MISKRTLMSAHRWTGIVAGLFLCLQGLSGLVIVFRDEWMAVLEPKVATSDLGDARASLDVMVAQAARLHGEAQILRIAPPRPKEQVTQVRLSDHGDRLLFFASHSGRLLKDTAAGSFVPEWLYDWHTRVLAGESGRWIVMLDGLALLFMAVSGVWFWWPGRQRIKQSLKIPWNAPLARVVGSLHRFSGVVLCLFLGSMAITGIALVVYDELSAALGRVTPVTTFPAYPSGPDHPPLRSLDDTVSEIGRVLPGERIKNLRFKTRDMRVVRAVLEADGPDDWHIDQVWIDRADGRVLATERAFKDPAGSKVMGWLLPLHSGRVLGLPGRLLTGALGLALALFAASGLWLWSVRRFGNRPGNPARPSRS